MILNLSQICPKEILTKTGNKTYPLRIAQFGEKILVANTKDKHKNILYRRYLDVPPRMICLWYSWPAGKNQSHNKNNGFRTNYLLVPQNLLCDKLTFNALGLLQAEMTKGSMRKGNISFSNSEPNLVNIIIQFFKRFGIQENDWSWSIVSNFKLKENETITQTKEREQFAEQFWLESTPISLKKRRNKFILYTGNHHYQNMRPGTMRFGSLRIDLSNLILYQLIRQLLEDSKKLKSLEFVHYYLQGIFAGEGCVRPTKFGSLDNVNIDATSVEDQKLYFDYLLNLGITSSFEKNCVKIHNLENFIKIYQLELLELHPIRHHKFLKSFVKFKQIPKRLKGTYHSLREEVSLDESC